MARCRPTNCSRYVRRRGGRNIGRPSRDSIYVDRARIRAAASWAHRDTTRRARFSRMRGTGSVLKPGVKTQVEVDRLGKLVLTQFHRFDLALRALLLRIALIPGERP